MNERRRRRERWAAFRDPGWIHNDSGKIRLSAAAAIAGFLLLAGLLFGQVVSGAPSTNAAVPEFEQCANGAAPSTATDCPSGWINGILNPNNSHYEEGKSVPQHWCWKQTQARQAVAPSRSNTRR